MPGLFLPARLRSRKEITRRYKYEPKKKKQNMSKVNQIKTVKTLSTLVNCDGGKGVLIFNTF